MEDDRKRLKSIYRGMKSRCYNKNSINYKYYGGKGVIICEDWLSSFENFYEWAISNGYNKELTIDRIHSEKGYSPDNCKWSTKKEQCYNRSMSVKLTLNGKTMYLTQWAEELNIDKKILSWRYNNGWSDEEILTRPRDYKENKLTLNGETHSISEWSRITGIKVATISYRVRKGWSDEEILTRPTDYKESKLTLNEETHSMSKWSKITGINASTISARIRDGWSVEDALTKNSNDREIKITYNNKTKTLKEWAEYLGVPKLRLNNRRNKGWTDEEIIEGKRRKQL